MHVPLKYLKKKLWKETKDDEYRAQIEENTWEFVELTEKPMLIFKLKDDENGNIVRHKARLVTEGFNQKCDP